MPMAILAPGEPQSDSDYQNLLFFWLSLSLLLTVRLSLFSHQNGSLGLVRRAPVIPALQLSDGQNHECH
jgi:hypothetical protein